MRLQFPVKVVAVAVLTAAGFASSALANPELFRKAAPSTVIILGEKGNLGSGTLIDVKNRLILTAAHVAGKDAKVNVMFAQRDTKGKIITETRYYLANQAKLQISGKVIATDLRRDLALVQLDRLPDGVTAVALAADAPENGETVHVIGNSTFNHGGVFRYCQGKVSNVFFWDPPALPIQCKVVDHHAPTNKGDSGGPVLNDKGELVAVISQGTTGSSNDPKSWDYQQQVVDHSICVTEVHQFLKNNQGKLTASK